MLNANTIIKLLIALILCSIWGAMVYSPPPIPAQAVDIIGYVKAALAGLFTYHMASPKGGGDA